MLVCDRCRKIARIFAYGDYVNNSYDFCELCADCTKELKEIIWQFRKKDITNK